SDALVYVEAQASRFFRSGEPRVRAQTLLESIDHVRFAEQMSSMDDHRTSLEVEHNKPLVSHFADGVTRPFPANAAVLYSTIRKLIRAPGGGSIDDDTAGAELTNRANSK